MDSRPDTWIFLGTTGLGGTHTVFRTLEAQLRSHRIRLSIMNADEAGCLRGGGDGLCGAKIVEAIANERPQGVIANAFVDRRLMNAVRYLPPELPTILIVHNMTHATYGAAKALRDFVHQTVAVSPRIRADLVGRHGFRPDAVTLIANGVEPPGQRAMKSAECRYRILSFGRLENRSKGILDIPKIVRLARSDGVTLSIGGEGPDAERLFRLLEREDIGHTRLGVIDHARLGDAFSEHGIYLFPSRYEGFPVALIEAMSGGLVPVAARIRGVTDVAIRDGEDGFLFEPGDWPAAARAIDRLVGDAGLWTRMSDAARHKAGTRFGAEAMGSAYAGLLRKTATDAPALPRLPIGNWRYPHRLTPGLRRYLPEAARDVLRRVTLRP